MTHLRDLPFIRFILLIFVVLNIILFIACSKPLQKKAVTVIPTTKKSSQELNDAPVTQISSDDDAQEIFDTNNSLITNSNLQMASGTGIYTSYIPLLKTETLLSTITVDLNGDGNDDQIIAVKSTSAPYIALVTGIYDSVTNTYHRESIITTTITNSRTFSYATGDLIGNHSTCIIWQGIDSNGRFVLCAYNNKLHKIADIAADVNITLTNTTRGIVYDNGALGDPIQIVAMNKVTKVTYTYTRDKEEYIKLSEEKLSNGDARVANKPTDFTSLISGLWTKESSLESHQIFFDCDNREVILITSDSQGVYTWEELGVTASGAYLTANNSIIASITRRFDITIKSVNELVIHVHENIGMAMSVTEAWDGTYQKQNITITEREEPHLEFQKLLGLSKWLDDNGNEYVFRDNAYTSEKSIITGSGVFTLATVGELPCIEFKLNEGHSRLLGNYALQFESTKVSGTQSGTRNILNKDIIYFIPVILGALECTPSTGSTIILHKKEEISDSDRQKLQKTRLLRFTM